MSNETIAVRLSRDACWLAINRLESGLFVTSETVATADAIRAQLAQLAPAPVRLAEFERLLDQYYEYASNNNRRSIPVADALRSAYAATLSRPVEIDDEV